MINALVLFSDKGAVGQSRVKNPVQAVSDRNFELGVHAEATNNLGVDATRAEGGHLDVQRVYIPGGIHVVSFQRPFSPGSSDVIAWLRANRPDLGVVVDVDADAPEYGTDKYLRRAISMADAVTLSTEEQLETYPHPCKFVIRDSVPATMLNNPSRTLSRRKAHAEIDADRIIGTITHDDLQPWRDLDVMGGALTDVVGVDRTGGRRVTFRNIGEKSATLWRTLGLQEQDVEASGKIPLNLQQIALGEMDVAVVPQSSPGSARKAIEFAAAGVPVIASLNPEHQYLQNQGMPLWLVKSRRREWLKALRAVLSFDDAELRDLAKAHRENVRQNHTIEQRAPQWAQAWRSAARRSR